jgi:hypothetical protein
VLDLIDVFSPIETIAFYEFNSKTEAIPGLKFLALGKPMISIWPAQRETSAEACSALLGVCVLFQVVMQMVKSPISPTLLREMNEQVAQSSKLRFRALSCNFETATRAVGDF